MFVLGFSPLWFYHSFGAGLRKLLILDSVVVTILNMLLVACRFHTRAEQRDCETGINNTLCSDIHSFFALYNISDCCFF